MPLKWFSKQSADEESCRKHKLLLWSNLPFALLTLIHVFHESLHLENNLYSTITVILGYIALNIFNALQVHAVVSNIERFALNILPNILIIALVQIGESSFDAVSQILMLYIIMQASYAFGGMAQLLASLLSIVSLTIVHLLLNMNLMADITFIAALAALALGGWFLDKPQSHQGQQPQVDKLSALNIATFSIENDKNGQKVNHPNAFAKATLGLSTGSNPASFAIVSDQSILQKFITKLSEKESQDIDFTLIRGEKPNGTTGKYLFLAAKASNQELTCVCLDISRLESKYNGVYSAVQRGQTSTLVAAIIHDFRNILTTIIGTAEVLEFTLTDQQAIEQVQRIIASGDRGTDKINSLLELDTHHKKHEKETEPADINNVIDETLSILRLQLPDPIVLEYQSQNELPPFCIEPQYMELILSNLVQNSWDAIDNAGKINVTVSSEQSHDGQTLLKLNVTDNGCGINEEDIPLITQTFWSTKQEKSAAGLGLSIVKRTVTKLGGTLDISSTVGVGTQVSITIPEKWNVTQAPQEIQTPVAVEKTPSVTNKVENSHKSIPCSILLVDDNTDVLASQTLLVEAMGHKAYTATSGQEGLDLYSHQKDEIKLVISDFKMPYMDGIELSQELRKVNPSLPIIMLTGYGESSKLAQCKDMDIALILKPCGFQKLSQTIFDVQNKHPEIFS